MAEMSNSERADMTFKSLCNVLDSKNWKYDSDAGKRMLNISFKGEDIPIELSFSINEDLQILNVSSYLPFTMPEDKRVEGAIAACAYSYSMLTGNFDYDMDSGRIVFWMTQFFSNREISDDLFMDMINIAMHYVEEYNDKFFMLSKNMLSIDDIVNPQS